VTHAIVTAPDTSLQAAMARATAIDPDGWYGGAVGPAPEGTVTIARLAAEPGRLDVLSDLVATANGYGLRDVAAGFVWGDLVYRVLAAPLVCAAVDGIAPVTGPSSVAITFGDTGASVGVTFTEMRHLTLHPDASPEAVHCADRGALVAALREQFTRTLGPLVPVLSPRVRRSERVLWLEACDIAATLLTHVGEKIGRGETLRAFADALLDGTGPLPGRSRWLPFTHAGITCTHHLRHSCCRYYAVGPAPCGTCPLRSAEQRAERFREWNERRAAELAAR